ncbi:MAG: GNAT family N-acetyltransferase [Candidatus Cyclonatronum sp.]|uniref:GNAT family N-acetyltransferase n=1 Tax=Cyclonatronum sp. TaxID=3024185 RepID=UPI0025C3A832|nr:GNAT family N-acetyltransferase [Cyclonatronum sp.]MCC5935537.1 GNAT family N-acetyltransferase [Balneolales bacterium]MCH8485861.1 GNAT family N-acetyltransferase [Cyclonatronum sp.]
MTISVKIADYEDPQDAAALLNILNSYSRDEMGQGHNLDPYVIENLIAELEDFPTAVSFLAFVDGEPAGLANCFLGLSTFSARRLLNIHDLAVLPEFRGTGVGSRLLEMAEAKALQMDCCKITLEVRDDNRAKALYLRNGYKPGDPEMLFWSKPLG